MKQEEEEACDLIIKAHARRDCRIMLPTHTPFIRSLPSA
jgi:hypothetical protein